MLTAVTKINRVDVAKALKLRLQGASLPDIAALQGVSKQAVYQALTKFEPFVANLQPGMLTAYNEERVSLFNAIEMHLSASLIDPQVMAKASLNNRAYAFKQIHEARRLESGQATSNVSVLGKLILQAEEGLGGTPALKATQAIDHPASHTPQQGVRPATPRRSKASGSLIRARKQAGTGAIPAGDGHLAPPPKSES
jgi:predicted DNA-binding protein YlxM (UPF0122 family)